MHLGVNLRQVYCNFPSMVKLSYVMYLGVSLQQLSIDGEVKLCDVPWGKSYTSLLQFSIDGEVM